MLSYNNDPGFKSQFVALVDEHRALDMLQKGTYGDEDQAKFRGCAVGCSIRSLNRLRKGEALFMNDHAGLASGLGIPLALAHLEDRIFEGLPQSEAFLWPGLFARAIPVGADMSTVWPKFAVWLLTDVLRFASEQTKPSIVAVIELFRRQLRGELVSLEDADAAADAAYVAYAAADAAADAAYVAYARQAYYRLMAEALLRIMSEAT